MDADVVISGGSFAGSTLALALARKGLKPVVVERLNSNPRICKADSMHPRTYGILESLGASEALRQGTVPLTHFNVGFPGRRLISVDLRPGVRREAPLFGVDHQRLIAPLRALATEAGATFVRDSVIDVIREGGAIAGVRLESGNEIRARLTVGADGPNSVVRLAMGVPERRWGHESMAAGGLILQLPEPAPQAMTMIFKGENGRGGFAVALPGNRLRLYVGPGAEPFPMQREPMVNYLAELFPAWADALRSHTDKPWAVPSVTHLQVGAWVVDGAVLVGDAGNVVFPFAGQGMNLAIRGAYVLADQIARCTGPGLVRATELEAYSSLMLKGADEVHKLSANMGRPRGKRSMVRIMMVEGFYRSLGAFPWMFQSYLRSMCGDANVV